MSTAITAQQVAVNIAFDRFAQHVVYPTYKKDGKGLYDFPVKNYVISVNIDAGFPDNVGLKILFGDKLEVASGQINFNNSLKATVKEHSTTHHLFTLADHLTGMLDRGEFAAYGNGLDKNTPEDGMFVATYKNLVEKFNRAIVSPARQNNPPGKYQWSVGEYTLEVDFPESSVIDVIPFTIFRDKSGSLGGGGFNTADWSATNLVLPPPNHVMMFLDALSRMVGDGEPMSPAWEESQVEEPPMVLITNNTPDISDEWVNWFCKRNPGTSYAKAIHVALTHLTTEARKIKVIVDKYSINRY